jgi:glycosyltransferase involved in cell wall biosynthesis
MSEASISISIGPGQHSFHILETLKKHYELKQSFHIYPDFVIRKYNNGIEINTTQIKLYKSLQRIVWALWLRLPFLKTSQIPKVLFYNLADKLIKKNLEECSLFIAWSQISLQSIRKMKKHGAKVMLEHQMSHVSKWVEIVNEEYSTWRKITKGSYSFFPKKLVEQMLQEYEESDFINVLSSYAKKSFTEQRVTPEKIIVTPFGIDTVKFRPKGTCRNSDGKIRILYVGRMELLKGVQYLLEAFIALKCKQVELNMVGPILPEILPLLEKYQDEGIKLFGSVPNEDLTDYYQNADIFVFPSINDAFGVVVLEAMACGLPVITTENSCAHDVVVNGKNGFVIPIRDSKAIKEKLEILIECKETRLKMGIEARKTVEENFSIEHYEERYFRACEKALGRFVKSV